MKVNRFNKIYEGFEYSHELKTKIEKFGWNEKDKVRYHIAKPQDKNPEDSGSYQNLEGAINALKRMYVEWDNDDTYCLFESRVRVMTDEDIELALTSKKYNL